MNSYSYCGEELAIAQNAVNWKNYFSSKVNQYISGDVLEVGAGIGANLDYLIKNNSNKICTVTCIEPDPEFAKMLHVHDIGISKKVINGTVDDLDDYSFFDSIIYIDVLEHIKDSRREIELVTSRLKDDGYLIILVPAFNFLYTKFDKSIGHYRRYDKELLLNDTQNLVKSIELFYLDSIGFYASLANKLFFDKGELSLQSLKIWDRYLIPVSRICDPIFRYSYGKSLIGVFKK